MGLPPKYAAEPPGLSFLAMSIGWIAEVPLPRSPGRFSAEAEPPPDDSSRVSGAHRLAGLAGRGRAAAGHDAVRELTALVVAVHDSQ
jgi:hypothetical protein